ncbi:MAG: hypothetical protein ACREPR_06360, partial [Brasilonema sp.]
LIFERHVGWAMPTISRLYLGFDEHCPPYRYLHFFKNQTGLLYQVRLISYHSKLWAKECVTVSGCQS